MAVESNKVEQSAGIEQNDYRGLLLAGQVDEAKALFATRADKVDEALKQWNVATHVVNDRKQKFLDSGEEISQNKLPIPYQKVIVKSAVAFLYGKPLRLIQKSKGTDEAFALLQNLWEEMRMASLDRKNARTLFSQTVAAKLFLPYKDDESDSENTAKCVLLSKKNGDTLYTKKDMYGVMKCIARGYTVTINNEPVEYFDAYFKDIIIYCKKMNGIWSVESKPNLVKKIPISYYEQEDPEWHDVQALIERYEMLTSKKADNNDYTGDAILVVTGDVDSLPGKDETGKVVKLTGENASAKYLAPEMAIDMVKEEKTSLKELIHYCTDTPDLTTDQLSSLGQDSGKALVMRFFPAILKAMDKEEIFAEMVDREINILKAMIANVLNINMAAQIKNLKVGFEFGNPLPDNIKEIVTMLTEAAGGKPIISQKTAVTLNPLVKDADTENTQIESESMSTLE